MLSLKFLNSAIDILPCRCYPSNNVEVEIWLEASP